MNIAATNMMEKYGLDRDYSLMTNWLDQTHSSSHMPWGEYLLFWSQAKEKFLTKLFGGELIRRYDINFSKSNGEMVTAMNYNGDFQAAEKVFHCSMMALLGSFFKRRYKMNYDEAATRAADQLWYGSHRLYDTCEDYGNIKFTEQEEQFLVSMSRVVSQMRVCALNYSSLADNKCNFAGTFRIPEATKPFQVAENQKPFKMLTSFVKYMAPYVDETSTELLLSDIETFRIAHSQVLNTKNTRGKLCLSIHPMDYMTMSDNGCDWHSCMRWDDEDGIGEYHAGTLEMMTSSSVIVAYLESKDAWYPVEGEKAWSNKKWRELFIVTPDFITGIKGYPYCSETLETVVFEKLSELMAQNCGITFNQKYVSRHDDYIRTEKGVHISFSTSVMYNDCEWNEISGIFAQGFNPDGDYTFRYGEGCYCIKCGKMRTYEDGDIDGRQDELVCCACSRRRICSHCGDIISGDEDDVYTDPNGNYICYDCNERIREDEITGEWGWDEDFSRLDVQFVSRSGARTEVTFTICDTTRRLLERDGAARETRKIWSYRWELVEPVSNDSACAELKKFFEDFERDNECKIWYSEVAVETEKKEAEMARRYSF